MNKPRAKMPVSERAKQFMPFAAVTGLNEALAKKEKEAVQRAELSEETLRELNDRLKKLTKGSAVAVTYYKSGEYVTLRGKTEAVDTVFGTLRIEGVAVSFDDISAIEESK